MNKISRQEQYYYQMLQLEKECIVDTSKILDYPPVALSYGEKLIKSKKGDQLLPIPLEIFHWSSQNQKQKKPFLYLY